MSGYLSFKRTGHKEVDAILQAIEDAGDAYHCTSNWDEESASGKSYSDIINAKIEEAQKELELERMLML